MSTDIYDGFGYDYEKELQKNSDNFVPLGSKKSKTNIRMSPIVVPVAPVAVKNAKSKPMPAYVSVNKAERPTITTARKAIIQKMPIIVKQNYDYELNRPFSPIQVNSSTTKRDDDDWGSIYDKDFYGGKKRSRSTRRKRRKSVV